MAHGQSWWRSIEEAALHHEPIQCRAVAMAWRYLTMQLWFLSLQSWSTERLSERLDLWATESLECYKWTGMSHSGGSLRGQNYDRMWVIKARLMEFQRETGIVLEPHRYYSCYIVAKKLATFC